jgi:Tfp pilus assembly protein PilF
MNTLHRLSKQTVAGTVAVAVVLWVLAGCVTPAPIKTEPAVLEAAQAPAADAAQLEDGRDGFIITEVSQMNAVSRQAFDHAVAMLNAHKYDEAVKLLEQVTAQSPGVTAPFINLGIAYQRIDKHELAEEQFKTALQLVPGHPVACNEYGLLVRKRGRFDEARALYEQALTGFHNYYPVHRNLGILCDIYLNDLECALGHYEIYSRAMPEDKQVKMWIADLRARLGLRQ